MTADRRKRHLKILELISTRAVRTQEELAEALATEGWEVTQSSVSRDIAALRLVKVDGAYRRPPPRCERRRIPTSAGSPTGCSTVEPAGDALVVLHTPPGEANRVAVALDRLAWPDVVGTIAGDDTIFLAVKDGAAQRRVLGEVRKLDERMREARMRLDDRREARRRRSPCACSLVAAAGCSEKTGALTPSQQQRLDSEGIVRRADDLMFRYTHDAGRRDAGWEDRKASIIVTKQSVIIHKNEKLGLEITPRTRRFVQVRRDGDRVRISAGGGAVGGELVVRAAG